MQAEIKIPKPFAVVSQLPKDADAIASRRDVARMVKDRSAVGDFPRFMDDVRRAVLTPTQKLGCELLAEDTLLRGFYSVWYHTLNDFLLDVPGNPPRVGPRLLHAGTDKEKLVGKMEANDLSPLFKQLEALRIIRAEWSQRDGWYVLVLPVCANWNVSWRCPASRRALRWMHLDGLRRAAAPFLPSFAPDADLYDALCRAGSGASSVSDAPLVETASEEKSLASRQHFYSAQKTDAPVVLRAEERGEDACRRKPHSEIRNATLLGNGGAIPKVGMPCARAAASRLKTQDSRLKINLKSWSDYLIEEKKSALIELEDCNSDDRVRALLNIILGDDVTARDGGKWIKAHWSQRAGVQSVMTLVVDRLGQTHLERIRCTGRLAHSYAASCGVKFFGDPLF